MYLADTHTHSFYSFDGAKEATIDAICDAAIKKGLDEIAITDHYECIFMLEGFYPMIDLKSREKDILKAKKKYDEKIFVSYGIEIGQPSFAPQEMKELIEGYNFDFVIGALHTVPGIRDIYYEDFNKYTNEQIVSLFNQYLDETEKLVALGGFDTLAHLTYPWRYLVKYGRQDALNLEDYIDRFSDIFALAIKNNIAIECNSSGFRQGLDSPMPNFTLMKIYYNLGGRAITIGSDAHRPLDIGSDIEKTTKALAKIGFEYITVFRERVPVQKSII